MAYMGGYPSDCRAAWQTHLGYRNTDLGYRHTAACDTNTSSISPLYCCNKTHVAAQPLASNPARNPPDAPPSHQMRDPAGEHSRLTRTGPGHDSHGPDFGEHGGPLGLVEVVA